jgi:oxygen-independent coproporphyrinogen-3 oxidase
VQTQIACIIQVNILALSFSIILETFCKLLNCSVLRRIAMAGIYIHIPFCKQACYYCNFHFSTVLSYKEKLVEAIAKELFLRKDYLKNQAIQTIYLGGGTPSLLDPRELDIIFNTLHKAFDLSAIKEFTLEANPDDLNSNFLNYLKKSPINRLSIGIQSFNDTDLQFMNRAHKAEEAINCIKTAQNIGFNNISIDLIYGIPGMNLERWHQNLATAFSLHIQHLSSYCLTIEPKTVFGNQLAKNHFITTPEEDSEEQFLYLIELAGKAGFEQYEISNFAKDKAYAQHNTQYWKGSPYLGVGPGAHSFKANERSWNISNNQQYMHAIEKGILPLESETLSIENQYNEWVMTGLRTIWGLNLDEGKDKFGSDRMSYLQKQLAVYINHEQVKQVNNTLIIAEHARFLADGIASAAFMV